jgi:FdhE protein
MAYDPWLTEHPYLHGLAEFHKQVETVISKAFFVDPRIPDWTDYTTDFRGGVPLLQSARAAVDLQPAENVVASVMKSLFTMPLPSALQEASRAVAAEFGQVSNTSKRVVAWLLGRDEFTPAEAGLLRCVGWIALARYLRPLIGAFDDWRDGQHWLRRYCPTCGSGPAMAQLVASDTARLRLLSCGCCGARWNFRRTKCPFCENEDDQRLTTLVVEGEARFRIDYCEVCTGYIKTYTGIGNESVLLADWTSLHLDVIAMDHGLKRLTTSLYEL